MATDGRDRFVDNLRVGLDALRAHRLRSGLATLGVVFGVAAVVCMTAIGKGAERRVLSELRRLGVRNLHVEARTPETGSAGAGLVEDDAAALGGEFAPAVHGTAPVRTADRRAAGRLGTGRADVRLVGVTADYARFLDLRVVDGRFIADLDQGADNAVCVLGEPLAAALFGRGSPLGEIVRCGGFALRVVGVVGGTALEPEGRPPLFVPLGLARAMLPRERDPRAVQRIVVHLAPGVAPAALAPVVGAALARRHGGSRDFEVVVPLELLRKERRTQRVFQFVMGGIAGISLLVGGIGIANIMLASVVERTSEIGLRRAVGARRADVLTQFLAEAAAIGVTGGITGLVLGLAAALLLSRAADWPVVVSPAALVVAAATAIATGLVSGAVPAHRAARVETIVALRHE